jgi:hypothetical protein
MISENLPEVFNQWIEKNLLNRSLGLAVGIPFAPATGETRLDPIGRSIVGTLEARGIHECLQQDKGVIVNLLPILRDNPGHSPQNMGGKRWYLNPG